MPFLSFGQSDSIPEPTLVYMFDIREEIAPPVVRTTQKAFKEARDIDADIILIHMNTYGGLVDAADSIRTRILNCKITNFNYCQHNASFRLLRFSVILEM